MKPPFLPSHVDTYGFRFVGVPSQHEPDQAPDWEVVHVVVRHLDDDEAPVADIDPTTDLSVTHDRAVLRMREGWVTIDRLPEPTVTFALTEHLPDAAFVHPYLAFPAAVLNHWRGRTSLHAGALVSPGGCVAILGAKEAGKSTTMAAAAASGTGVMTDDLLVLDGTVAFAGPRCIDLREPAALRWGGTHLGVIGARERWRLRLGPVPSSTPVAAVVRLAWGPRLEVEELAASKMIPTLFENSALGQGPAQPDGLFDLVALPCYEVRRPRDLDRIDAFVATLVGLG